MSDKARRSVFPVSKLVPSFSSKVIGDSDAMRSPTSILDSKPFFMRCRPFFVVKENSSKLHWSNKDSSGIGLGIIETLINGCSDNRSLNPSSKLIVFERQLKVQIPQVGSGSNSSTGSLESSHSPTEIGIKNRDSQSSSSPGCLSHKELELLEEYTCVITHGPNPKRTHIFDNRIMEYCGDDFAERNKESRASSEKGYDYPRLNPFGFCHACKKNLLCKEVWKCRGEVAFCSNECRESMSDDEMTHYCFRDLSELRK